MHQPRLCLHTQTPPLLFRDERPTHPVPLPLQQLQEGRDYQPAPGGVSRMVGGLLRRLTTSGRVQQASWISLSKRGPQSVAVSPHVTLQHARLPSDALLRYAVAKAALWRDIHRIGEPSGPSLQEVRQGLTHLSAAFGRRTHELHERRPFDLFYVHDFQLLPLASHLPREVPRVFRWHIPVPPKDSRYLGYMVDALNRYDAVIVSTHAYAERLTEAGVRVPIHASYPYLDESRERVVTGDDARAFDERWGLEPDDVVFLLVARMDPMKSHDTALRALARIAEDVPNAKLMLVGDGGFSGDARSGLGLDALSRWQDHLRELARALHIEDRVLFTGNLPDAEVDVAYTRCRSVLLPSRLEGFGLAAVEGWLYGRPAVVSRGAGVAELIEEGRNGHAFEPGDDAALADILRGLADDPARAAAMGRQGRGTACRCHLVPGTDSVWRVLQDALATGRTLGPTRAGTRGRI